MKAFGLFGGGRDRLWLAPDHLLYARKSYYSENCRRFYLKDIQAIVVSRTSAGRVMNWFMGVAAATFVVMAGVAIMADGWPSPSAVILSTIAFLFVVPLVINTFMGPTCVCKLYTAVQVEDLIALRRLRYARKTVGVIKQAVESAQGALRAEGLETLAGEETIQAAQYARNPKDILSLSAMGDKESEATRHEGGKYHRAMFYLMLFFAASNFIDIFYQHMYKNMLDTFATFVFVFVIVVSIIKQHKSDMPFDLKFIGWTALAVMAFSLMFDQFSGIAQPVRGDLLTQLQTSFHSQALTIYWSVRGVIWAALGCAGLIWLKQFRFNYAGGGDGSQKAAGGETG